MSGRGVVQQADGVERRVDALLGNRVFSVATRGDALFARFGRRRGKKIWFAGLSHGSLAPTKIFGTATWVAGVSRLVIAGPAFPVSERWECRRRVIPVRVREFLRGG